jgi:hypothetical protein
VSGSALSAEDVDPQEVMTSDVCPDSDMAICLPGGLQLKTSKDRTPLHEEGGSTPKGVRMLRVWAAEPGRLFRPLRCCC